MKYFAIKIKNKYVNKCVILLINLIIDVILICTKDLYKNCKQVAFSNFIIQFELVQICSHSSNND